MKPHFSMNHLEKGVEVNFITSKDSAHLEPKKFANAEIADKCIKKLKRYRNFDSYRFEFEKGKYRFYLVDSNDVVICRSHPYSTKQKAEHGVEVLIREMYRAPTKEQRYRR